MLASITNNNSPPLLKPEDTFSLDDEIDDDESYQRKETASIDTAHQFLNFSRKVTEASSMRRPVDIQLGIACGKDLVFSSSSRLRPPTSSLSLKPSFTTTHLDRNKKKLEPTTVKKIVPTNTEKKLNSLANKPTTKIANDNKEMKHRSLPLQQLLHNHHNDKDKSTTTTTHHPTSSPLLDRLVADVLNHIDSCPDRSAYSDDLDRLKPKLQAYSVTRLPPSLTSSS
jgi:hypothetical protein